MTARASQSIALVAALVGLFAALLGWRIAPEVFPHAWLAAFTVYLSLPIGCMGLLLIHTLTGGSWGCAIRVQLVSGMNALVLLPLAFIPLALTLQQLYPWLRYDASQLPNGFYLNRPFFIVRMMVYLVIWFGLGAAIREALRRVDPVQALARIAPIGLVLLAITYTFAMIDLTMSLDPRFSSSVYGLIAIAEAGLFALAVAIFARVLGDLPDGASSRDLGGLLIALIILWAYLDFMQLLIIWQSDLPSEAAWYAIRLSGAWGKVAGAIAVTHFALPFLLLLAPRTRRSRGALAGATLLLVIGVIMRVWWLVAPASPQPFGVTNIAAMLGLLGATAWVALVAPRSFWREPAERHHVG